MSTKEELLRLLKEELPKLIKEEPELRALLFEVLKEQFAERSATEERFYILLEEIHRMRNDMLRMQENIERMQEEVKVSQLNSERLQIEMARMREEMLRMQEEIKQMQETIKHMQEEMARMREEMLRMQEEIKQMQETIKQMQEEIARMREDMLRMQEEIKQMQETIKQMQETIKQMQEEIRELQVEVKNLREDFNRLYELSENRHKEYMKEFRRFDLKLTGLGARWGIFAEHSFREGMKAILEESFPVIVEQFRGYDRKGMVFGRPDQIELDLIIRDGEVIAVEIKSSMSKGDVSTFAKKVQFYEEYTGRKVSRRIFISPFMDRGAKELAQSLGIETYTMPDEVENL
jgi:hypothetical protein